MFLSLRLYSQLHLYKSWMLALLAYWSTVGFFCSWNPEASSENNVPSCVPTRSTPWVKFHPSWSCFHIEYWEMGLINMHKTGREFVTNPSKHLKGRSRERFCETVYVSTRSSAKAYKPVYTLISSMGKTPYSGPTCICESATEHILLKAAKTLVKSIFMHTPS